MAEGGVFKEGPESAGKSIPIAESGGVGLDLRITKRITCRLLQADFLRTTFMSGTNAIVTTGLVYGFGRR